MLCSAPMPLLIALLGAAAFARSPAGLRLEEHRPTRYALELTVDPEARRLEGLARIEVALDHPARALRLNGSGLEILAANVTSGGLTEPARALALDDQTLSFSWDRAARDTLTLELRYAAPISELDTAGAFLQREGEDSYVFTQMQPLDARRVFPSFDQPDLKAPFAITLRVPADLGAFSNAPAAREQVEGGWKTVVFEETRPLPTYLVAFAVGPFDVVEAGRAGRGGTPVRVLTPRGRAADAAFAASITGPLLEDLERWLDIPYPFEKLDVVSLPQPVGWGAMENAGLVTMEQSLLIASPEAETPARQRDCAEVLAHELAHHWFGNLVTPAWWDDLWLNESLATWMSLALLEARWPQWRIDVTRVAWQGEAMAADSLRSARAVREPIRERGDVEGAFDSITYLKGQSALFMTERWLGTEVFREGLRAWLREHAWGNATAEDFVAALSRASGEDLQPIFDGLLEKPGLPELEYTCKDDVTPVLQLTQARWLPEGSARGRWALPVCVRYPTAEGERRTCARIDGRRGRLPLEGAASCPAWLVPNDGQSGYYRVRYGEEAVSALLDRGSALDLPERVGVLQDATGAVARGEIAPAALLDALPDLLSLGERSVTERTLELAAALDAHLVPEDLRPAYALFLRRTYGPLAAELGLVATPGEDEETRMLRPRVIALVGLQGEDPEIAAAAAPLAERWLEAREGLDPEIAPTVLRIAGLGGGLAWFERLREEVEGEPDRVWREVLFRAMGGQREPRAVAATLEWLSSGVVDPREAIPVLLGFLQREDSAATQWAWATVNLERLEAMVPSAGRAYLTWLGTGFCSEERAREVERFFAPHVGRWIGGRRALAQSLEQVRQCAASREQQAAGVRRFLETQASAKAQ